VKSLEKNGGPRVDRKQYGPLVAYALRDAVPRPPPSGAVAVAGGAEAAVPAGSAGACGCRPGGGPRGRQQRRAVGGAQARAEAAAAALAAAVPRRAGPSPGKEGGAASRDGGELGEALFRRRAAGGCAGALQQENGISLPFLDWATGIPDRCSFDSV